MDFSGPACPADFKIPVDLFISKKHPGLPRGNLGLADSSGNIVYKVDLRYPKHGRVLLDGAGKPLFSMRGSHVSLPPPFPRLFQRILFSGTQKSVLFFRCMNLKLIRMLIFFSKNIGQIA